VRDIQLDEEKGKTVGGGEKMAKKTELEYLMLGHL